MAHLALFETSGNQRFIFATNKLAENLGASQMIWDAGVRLVLQAVEEITRKTLFGASPKQTRDWLRDPSHNPKLGDGPIEIVTAASGKAILLIDDTIDGRKLVYKITSRCLKELPGVELRGVVGGRFDFDAASTADMDREMRAVHERLAALAGTLAGPEFRFLRLPIAAACATSNLPAAGTIKESEPDHDPRQPEPNFRSKMSLKKREQRDAAWQRIVQMLDLSDAGFQLPRTIEQLDRFQEGIDWLAVIHADGNGVGRIFQSFGEKSGARDARDYVNRYREFSLGLDECTEAALHRALVNAYARKKVADRQLAAVPLVLGDDDLTMVCDGRIGLRITRDFVGLFAENVLNHRGLNGIRDRITASAGVAIVKPHFPFHLAYELAEALLKSAKRRKPEPAIDFLVHYDASGGDLRQIRERLCLGDAQLYARPFRLSDDWARFERALDQLLGDKKSTSPDADDPIPRSLLHELRAAAFLEREAGDRQLRWTLARRGPGDRRLCALLEELHGDTTLFQKNPEKNGEPRNKAERDWRTGLLDVLEAQEFWR